MRSISRLLTVLSVVLAFWMVPPFTMADDATQAVRKARLEAADLIRKIGGTKDEAKRAAIVAELDRVDIRGRLPALIEGLKGGRAAGRRYCVDALAAMKIVQLVPHFVLVSTDDKDGEVRKAGYDAAIALERDYARRWYEHVAIHHVDGRRARALERIEAIGSPDSVPMLATLVQVVGLEVRTQVARLAGIETANVNLGAGSPAASSVPLQLPSIELIDVQVNLQLPVATQVGFRDAALRALRTIAGDLGSEPERYLSWYRDRKKS
jgi:hypothetical protein